MSSGLSRSAASVILYDTLQEQNAPLINNV